MTPLSRSTPPRLRTANARTRWRRRSVMAGCGLLAGALLLSGCHETDEPGPTATAATAAPPADTISHAQATTLEADFDALLTQLDGQASIAFAPVGGQNVTAFGDDIEDVAWSTMKVPLSIAAVRENGDSDEVRDLVERAITYSDNDATWTLWTMLGDMDSWIDKFDDVLRDGGDEHTVFEADRLHSGGPSYGESLWDDADQARFAAGLPCLADSGEVLDFMGQIDEEQRWGLGAIPGARFKGGWGPGEGSYLTRQFGIIDTANGQTAVAIVALPDSGSLEDGNAMLDEIAKWILAHQDQLPAGKC